MSDSPPHDPDPSKMAHYGLPIRRPVTVAMIFLSLVLFGWKSYRELSIDLMPEISYPTLTVRTELEGAAPEDVEQLVTRPLEERLSIVSGVVEISSISSAGVSEVIMEFSWDTDMNFAMQNVRESLDLFDAPQSLTESPVILRYDPTLDPVMRVAITGRRMGDEPLTDAQRRQYSADLTEIRRAAEKQLKSDLEAEVGIARVVVKGGREEEIQILVDTQRLKNLGLSLEMVGTSLAQHNINLSGGSLKEGKAEYLVRTLNEFKDIDAIRSVIVRSPLGRQFRLEEIAQVARGEKDRETIVRINGREAIELEIFKEGDTNTVKVCNKLKDFFKFERRPSVVERLASFAADNIQDERFQEWRKESERKKELADRLQTRLPRYAEMVLITEQSRFIVASIREVQTTAILGGLLALAVLYLFLREIKSTLIVGIAIPISIVATFIPMFVRDISLNIMSLGGLALGVGMLVDNAIVVLESIFRCSEEGDSPIDAAQRGTKEVASAVIASTLTTIAVFFPIVFVEGIAGQLFSDLALTVAFSLIASLAVALYLIPMIASRKRFARSAHDDPEANSGASSPFWMVRAYHAVRENDKQVTPFATIRKGGEFATTWFRETWAEAVGRSGGSTREGESPDDARAVGGLRKAVRLVMMPVMIVLFLLEAVLTIAATILLTLLFLMLLPCAVLFRLTAALLRTVFTLPIRLFNDAFIAVRTLYAIGLRRAIRFSPLILVVVALVALHAGQRALSLGRELIPPLKQGEFSIRVEAPPGTRLEDTERRAKRVETVVREFPEVASVVLVVGNEKASASSDRGENIALLTVKLNNLSETVPRQDEITDRIRTALQASSPEQITLTLPTLFSFKTALELQIYGDDLTRLREQGEEAVEAMRDIEGIKDIELSLKRGYPEVHIRLDTDLLASKQLSPYQVAQALRREIQGEVATQFSRGADKLDIRVRSDHARIASLEDLKNLSITEGDPPVPLYSVADIRIEEGPSEIRRINQRQVALVSANIEGRDLGSIAQDIHARLDARGWSREAYTLAGQQRELETSYDSLLFALLLAVFLVYVVMACQFESIWHPALIMFSVPLAFIGVVYVLDFADISLSIVVFIGAIVLAGIVVNDAIVLVDYINQLRARGLKKTEAIIQAGTVRFRPIMMTTITTVLALIPMVISSGAGAEIRRPMAITVMAGLCSATILTLVIIPVIYSIAGGRERK